MSAKKHQDSKKGCVPTSVSRIHVILDQARYHRSCDLQSAARAQSIVWHYLPPYRANLNPIERLSKVMNEPARNKVLFESPEAFRAAIANFLNKTVQGIKPVLRTVPSV